MIYSCGCSFATSARIFPKSVLNFSVFSNTKIDALSSQKDTLETTDFVKEFLIITLGAEAAEELIAKNYKIGVYVKIMNCIEEVYSGDAEKEESTSPTLV